MHTLRRWLSAGRKNPDGPHGTLAALVDRLKGAPRGPREHARGFILAYGAFVREPGDDNGKRVQAAVRAIPPNDEGKVMAGLANQFLYAVMRQMKPGTAKGDVAQACEEMFQEVDEDRETWERRAEAA